MWSRLLWLAHPLIYPSADQFGELCRADPALACKAEVATLADFAHQNALGNIGDTLVLVVEE